MCVIIVWLDRCSYVLGANFGFASSFFCGVFNVFGFMVTKFNVDGNMLFILYCFAFALRFSSVGLNVDRGF